MPQKRQQIETKVSMGDESNLVQSSSTSSGGEMEPVEVSLPLNLEGETESEQFNTRSEAAQAAENKPLLEDLNINPHHNTQEECLECSCERTTPKENSTAVHSDSEARTELCAKCSGERVTEMETLAKSENDPQEPSVEVDTDQAKLIPNSRTEPEVHVTGTRLNVEEIPADNESAISFVDADDIEPIMTQPTALSATVSNYCPPGLEDLLDVCQLVIHKSNFRKNIDISKTAVAKLEVVDISRKVVLHAEREPPPISSKSFQYKIYNASKKPVMEVYCPLGKTSVCCNATWHMCRCCSLQAMVSAPPGQIVGFIRRQHTRFVQEYHILNASEDLIFILRGGPLDLEIYTPALQDELGRLAVHNWVGIMREIKRSAEDYGITFPMDLDIRVKATLLGAVFLLDWVFTTKAGRRR